MNVPNILTLIRFLLIPVYLYVFFSGHPRWSLLIVLLAGLTDVLDGHIARTRGQVTEMGIMLDPLADKLMMATVFLSLLYSRLIPWLAAVAMVIRDGGMIIFATICHFKGKKPVPANILGKMTTVLFYCAILLIVFEVKTGVPFLWAVIVLSFVATTIYLFSFRRINGKLRMEPASAGDSLLRNPPVKPARKGE
ncbi:CDP-alcohol phosphatidyltransferase family protein [Gorillibacterium massiliense]|uniref:CDP-alcohol phosphatidyltransferase family protein n=1 Tax=Gorillibacterium massiliense TaxID=1280390 RepID=UPI000693353F|nr:CDP-alcohol phosphatidyltransferase family protein [Gorillibacterium massiliense]